VVAERQEQGIDALDLCVVGVALSRVSDVARQIVSTFQVVGQEIDLESGDWLQGLSGGGPEQADPDVMYRAFITAWQRTVWVDLSRNVNSEKMCLCVMYRHSEGFSDREEKAADIDWLQKMVAWVINLASSVEADEVILGARSVLWEKGSEAQ